MSWFRSEPAVIRVREVRFTQGDAKLHSVGLTLSTATQLYSTARFALPQPADPVSHRSKVCWPDTELRLSLDRILHEEIKITLVNRRRRIRTVVGSVTFTLGQLEFSAENGKLNSTLKVDATLLPALNLKIDIEVTGWRPRSSSFKSQASQDIHPLPTPRSHHSKKWGGTGSIPDVRVEGESHHTQSTALRSSNQEESASQVAGKPYMLRPDTPSHTHHRAPSSGSSASSASETSAPSLNTNHTSQYDKPRDAATDSDTASQISSLGALKLDQTTNSSFGFELGTDTLGLVFLEVISIANLPRFRTLTGLSFDMDPFVIVGFGRRVYKTPYRRHTLNPTFNSKIAFDVKKNETGFPIVFTVWDQDKITLNDRVAEAELPIQQVMRDQAPKLQPATPLASPRSEVSPSIFGPSTQPTGGTTAAETSSEPSEPKLYNVTDFTPSVKILPLVHEAGTAELLLKVQYYPMAAIRQQMWRGVIALYGAEPDTASKEKEIALSFRTLKRLLNSLGSSLTDDTIRGFFTKYGLDPATDLLKEELIVLELERIVTSGNAERVLRFRICPICHKKTDNTKIKNNNLQHLPLCASRYWAESTNTLLDSKYVSSQQASKRWYANFLSKFSYGSYKLGAHSANILVQDRVSGQISEEKMATSVRMAIRVIYALGPVERRRFQRMLKKYTLRQGIKYSSPSSASSIEPFIKFHNLDMSEVLLPTRAFKTFNEFFCRELKPDARACENSHEPGTAVSMADCRLTVFPSVTEATELWIKGRNFTLARLLGEKYASVLGASAGSADTTSTAPGAAGGVVIFRLAPQDYHRVHSPVDGVMGEPCHIPGQYYTVNPMAIRSGLDVFGENTRTVFPIDSPVFGRVMVVMVGAMMVGSCVVTRPSGRHVQRGEEVGYFQFGGSTVVLLFEPGRFIPDRDLEANSRLKIETLVKVGMSVGHAPHVPEYTRSYDTRLATIRRAKSAISGGGSYLPFSLD